MNAGRLAPWYRWIEYAAFGRALERARYVFLDRLRGARRVLVFGEGDGRMLARLLIAAPLARFDVIESSGEMIALARRRIGASADRVRFHQCDALCGVWPSGSYDVIVTHFFLDCFRDIEARYLISAAVDRMPPDALWLVTDFAIPPRGWRRWHAAIWIGIMYRFFRVATGLRNQSLPEIYRLLTEAGLSRLAVKPARAGLIQSEIWTKPAG